MIDWAEMIGAHRTAYSLSSPAGGLSAVKYENLFCTVLNGYATGLFNQFGADKYLR